MKVKQTFIVDKEMVEKHTDYLEYMKSNQASELGREIAKHLEWTKEVSENPNQSQYTMELVFFSVEQWVDMINDIATHMKQRGFMQYDKKNILSIISKLK